MYVLESYKFLMGWDFTYNRNENKQMKRIDANYLKDEISNVA